jgi:hypothetical protein
MKLLKENTGEEMLSGPGVFGQDLQNTGNKKK